MRNAVRLLTVIALGLAAYSSQAQRIAVMPTYNASVLAVGEQMAQFTTVELFQGIFQAGRDAVLVNPGGVYLPEDHDLIVANAQPLHASLALVTKLLPAERDTHEHTILKLHVWMVAIPSGAITEVGVFTETVKNSDATVEYEHDHFWGQTGSRVFHDQPIGKATGKLIDAALKAATPQMPQIAASAGRQPQGPECAGTFRVVYPRNKTAKSYDLLLDGRNESVVTEDGVASFQRATGPHLLVLHLNDGPYRLPLQNWYAVNFPLECPTADFAFIVGPGGEGRLAQMKKQ